MSTMESAIRLDAIRDFLKRMCASVDAEYSDVMRRDKQGEFVNSDELADAYFSPLMSEEIAVRATLSELNALIEYKLQGLANEPFTEEKVKRKCKRNFLVFDLARDRLIALIEGYYRVKLDVLPSFCAVEEIRHAVNACKHRDGWKDPRKDYIGREPAKVWEKFKLDRQHAFDLIIAVREFLTALGELRGS